MLFGDEKEPGEVAPVTFSPTAVPVNLRRYAVKVPPPAPVFHPLAYRGVVAEWPIQWRERWGRRANTLEEQGLCWRDAEAQAFVEVWSEIRAQHSTANLATTGVEHN